MYRYIKICMHRQILRQKFYTDWDYQMDSLDYFFFSYGNKKCDYLQIPVECCNVLTRKKKTKKDEKLKK